MLRIAFALLFVALSTALAAAQSPTPVGVWLPATARVEVARCGDRLCGRRVWFRWPNDRAGQPLVDLQNADPKLRGRPLLGLTIVRGLRRTGERAWGDGQIYNPDDGVDYLAAMSIQPDGA